MEYCPTCDEELELIEENLFSCNNCRKIFKVD